MPTENCTIDKLSRMPIMDPQGEAMSTEPEAPGGRLSVERFIHAPREKVFEAWTNAKSVSQWMRAKGVTSVDAELDPQVGGKLRLLTRGDEGDTEYTGEFRLLEPPSKLVFTWTSRDTDARPTVVTVELSEDEMEPGCAVNLTQSGFVSPEAVRKNGAAWDAMLDKLALLEKTKRRRRKKKSRTSR